MSCADKSSCADIMWFSCLLNVLMSIVLMNVMYWYFLSCWFCVNGPVWCLVFFDENYCIFIICLFLCLVIAHRATVMRLTCAWCLCQAFCDTSFCMYFNRLHAIAPRPLIILPRVPDTFRRRSCLRLLTYRSSEGLSFQQIETLTRPARQVLPTRVSENLPLFHACYFEVSPRFEVTPLTIISFSGIGRLETPKTLFAKG